MPGNGKVFVCHAHADNALCAPLLAALQAWGVDYWFDAAAMEAGADLTMRIQQAIAERDIFIRVCTNAAQQSYWARIETSAFRGLQAQAHRGGEDGRRVLINLILDPDYQREPFDLVAIFIDATHQPLSAWLDALRRALGLPIPNAPVGSAWPQEAASPTAPPTVSASPATTPHKSRPVRRRGSHSRAAIPAAVAFAIIVAFTGLLLSQTGKPLRSGHLQPSPTATWTLPPAPTATQTLVLTPAGQTAGPGPQQYTFADAHISIRIPLDWGTPNDEGLCSACHAVVINVPGPSNAFATIELLTDQWASASDPQVVNNADGWFLVQGGVTERSRTTVTVGGESCVRGEFTFATNGNNVTSWLFGCHHANHEYMLYFYALSSKWAAQSKGDIASMVNSIHWL